MKNRELRAWMNVDLGALVRNARAAEARAGVPIIPMVKADAYGLGAVDIIGTLEQVNPDAYGVATVEEGADLRDAGIERPIIVFSPLLRDEYPDARNFELTPSLGTETEIREWTRVPFDWHLSIDTGMSRAGIPWREVSTLREVLTEHVPEGAFTHFHSAELNDGSMDEQEQRFRDAVAQLPVRPKFLHTDASAAIARHGKSEWNAIRPGVFLYGVGSGEGAEIEPEPVVSIHSRIAETRWIEAGDSVSYDATWHADSRRRIATIPMGYADGYPRAASNRAFGIAKDGRVPIRGLVTMDMIMLDVTDSKADVGDVVTMMGRAENGDSIGPEELAALAGMSYYELLTGLRGRLDRYYIGEWT
ncbi:MAG TPA: alanine racemase [Gemmatimonadaceae bacterium]|nr:alanine racemase [Gemmatimonadaceae bacterium]